MRTIERKQAEIEGLKRYFTGKPCRHGHVAERYTISGGCVECGGVKKAKHDEKMRESFVKETWLVPNHLVEDWLEMLQGIMDDEGYNETD